MEAVTRARELMVLTVEAVTRTKKLVSTKEHCTRSHRQWYVGASRNGDAVLNLLNLSLNSLATFAKTLWHGSDRFWASF